MIFRAFHRPPRDAEVVICFRNEEKEKTSDSDCLLELKYIKQRDLGWTKVKILLTGE